jgi:DNA-binding CsgD family transcriptional regulator
MREATLHLPDPALESLGVGEFLSTVRDAGLRGLTELRCRRPGCLLVVDVRRPVDPDRLDGLETVGRWERLDSGAGASYLCELAVPALSAGFDPRGESDVPEERVAVTPGGVEVTMVGPQAALAGRAAAYDEATGVSLRSLGDYGGPTGPLDALTDRQREVLRAAFDCGYSAVPREATTGDVAAALDLAPSTVREHLQRAQRNLLSALLAE